MSVLPVLVVFDLDHTLWPFFVDTHVTPPMKKNSSGQIVDSRGRIIKHYEDVPEILEYLKNEGIKIAIASRTVELDGANQLLNLFKWNRFIDFKEIHPGSKITHFEKIKKDSGISFSDMLFFDDEERNIKDIGRLGVQAIHVAKGMTMQILETALQKFEAHKLSQMSSKL